MEIKKYSRKEFLSFLGKISLGAAITPSFLMACGNGNLPIKSRELSSKNLEELKQLVLENLVASNIDDLLLTKGLEYHTIVKWNDKINNDDSFGFNCDFTCFIPLD